MKKSTRIRPVLESLESMMLLSTMTPDVHELAKKTPVVTPIESGPVTLAGTLHGTGTTNGTTASLSGSGNLGKVGIADFKLHVTLASPPTTVTLATRRGNLDLSTTSPLVGSGSTGSTTYTITGGTKFYADATGSGSATASYSLLKSGRLKLTVHFA